MEVFALVGPAGTGKSHQALMVARTLRASALVDDGLFVVGSKVVAGVSAKYETTRLRAVHRAIFSDPDHARSVSEAIGRHAPERVLVLGTSEKMIRHICRNLQLPAPKRTLLIDDVSEPAQIEAARRSRLQEGKHVIPAPTMEVKRGFRSGVVLPMTLRYRQGRARRPIILQTSIVRPTYSSFGRFFITEQAVRDVSRHLFNEQPFIHTVSSVRVETVHEATRVVADVTVYPDARLIERLRQAQIDVHAGIERITALAIASLDVRVVGIVADAWREWGRTP